MKERTLRIKRGHGWHLRHGKRLKRRKRIAAAHMLMRQSRRGIRRGPRKDPRIANAKHVNNFWSFKRLWGIIFGNRAIRTFRNLFRNVASKLRSKLNGPKTQTQAD